MLASMHPIRKNLPSASRTGHGAASVIPHLNDDAIRFEPSQLVESEDTVSGDDESTTDHQKTSAARG